MNRLDRVILTLTTTAFLLVLVSIANSLYRIANAVSVTY